MVKVRVMNKTDVAAEVAVDGGAYGVMGVWYNGQGGYTRVEKDGTWGNSAGSMRHETFKVYIKINGVEQCAVQFTAGVWNKDHGDNCFLYFTTQGLFAEGTHKCLTTDQQFKTYVPFFLASTTDGEYDKAVNVVIKAGGENATGVAADYLNKEILWSKPASEAEKPKSEWKKGMYSKWFQCIDKLHRLYPGREIIALCIAGGPACDWERYHMTDPKLLPNVDQKTHIRSNFPNIRLKVGANAKDLADFIQRGLPLSECK